MKLNLLPVAALLFFSAATIAQDTKPRAINADEYALAKAAVVKDLDNDTYVKLNTKYVLDRYEMKKPYFITGDDGLRKRIDLYKLIARDSMQELGTVLFYTNEKGKRYTACLPSALSDAKIWERYFEDIHAIDKEEKNFVLKLSYVLSKEFSFLLGRLSGKTNAATDANYGNEICFPGSGEVLLANGLRKQMSELAEGERIVTMDPASGKEKIAAVQRIVVHEPLNYAITTLTLVKEEWWETAAGKEVKLQARTIAATPNHPVPYGSGSVEIGKLPEGAKLMCRTHQGWELFTVLLKEEKAPGIQPVFSLETGSGTTLVVDGVVVWQKSSPVR